MLENESPRAPEAASEAEESSVSMQLLTALLQSGQQEQLLALLRQADVERAQLRQALSTSRAETETARAQAEIARAEAETARAQVEAARGEVERLRSQLAEVRRQLETLLLSAKTPREHHDVAATQLVFEAMLGALGLTIESASESAEPADGSEPAAAVPAAPAVMDGGEPAAAAFPSQAATADRSNAPSGTSPKNVRLAAPHGRRQLPKTMATETLVFAPAGVPAGAQLINVVESCRIGLRPAHLVRLVVRRLVYAWPSDEAHTASEVVIAHYVGDVKPEVADGSRASEPLPTTPTAAGALSTEVVQPAVHSGSASGEPDDIEAEPANATAEPASATIEPADATAEPSTEAAPAIAKDESSPMREPAAAVSTMKASEAEPNQTVSVPVPGGTLHLSLAKLMPGWVRYSEPQLAPARPADSGPRVLVCPPLPDEIVPRGFPTCDMLARIVTAKYADKMPLNRLETIFAREGFPLARSTMCEWLQRVDTSSSRIVAAMMEDAKRAHCIGVDATGVLVQQKGRCKSGHVWAFIVDQDHIFFRYSATHDGDVVRNFFKGYAGTVLADAASVYSPLLHEPDGPVGAGCWSHARRYFWKAIATEKELALIGLGFANKLFELERGWKDLAPTRRLAERQRNSTPVIRAFEQWRLQALADPLSVKGSRIHSALQYSQNHWTELTRFLRDGALPIHNNAAELALRSIVVGRANWLFLGNERVAPVSTNFASLVASCQLHRLDPQQYLRDIFRVLPYWPTHRLLELCPRDWSATRRRIRNDLLALPLGPIEVPPAIV